MNQTNKMTPFFTSQNGYSSCIKIAGVPILPPLITEERRSALNEEKAKAIEIEKRIKRKRASIDSGVMTGSYIDYFKNSEVLLPENPVYNDVSISDLSIDGNIHNSDTLPSENDISDNFLKSALEDSEFREFFYNAAERIFKDNKILNENRNKNSSVTPNNLCPDHNEKKPNVIINEKETLKESAQVTIHPSKQNHIVNVQVSDGTISTNTVETNTPKASQEATNSTTLPSVDVENQPSLPPERVRRNSYTLDSPSPVLLEHMSKGIICKDLDNNWIEHSSKKEECKNLQFKTFSSTKKPRKTWNKKDGNHSVSPPRVGHCPYSKVPFYLPKKSKTFVRTEEKHYEDKNYSLPCSSRSSPTHLFNFAYSSDCIQTDLKRPPNIKSKNLELNPSNTCKLDKEVKRLQQQENLSSCENTIMAVSEKDSRTDLKISDKELKDTLSVNNDSVIFHQNVDMLVLFPSQDMFRNPNSNIYSCIDQSLVSQKISDCSTLAENRVFESKKDPSNEIDDTVSLCSSLSLSKFMPVDDNVSRPSTADLSTLFSELQLKHERQIAELLDMQHKEKAMLSQLHSNHGTISSQSTTDLSVSEFSSCHSDFFPVSGSAEKRTLCSRELFPSENGSPPKEGKLTANHYYNSETEKVAALKLTAYVRGYLTRRLLKTEKVQQLIDTIKESLNCAFSLQSETELRKNDLELHERLAHQLTSALYELQSIISASVATRMAIIATDREKLRKPVSRPSSAISSATQKAILRRQKSMNNSEKKSQDNNSSKTREIRPRAKSLCLLGTSGSVSSGKCDSSTSSVNNSRKPWR